MEWKILHFYPDLMSLYGSYANVSVLRRTLEAMGNPVTVTPVLPGQEADLSTADFIYMGAGTERAQKAALTDFIRFTDALKAAAEEGVTMLFAGNSMELLGKTVTDDAGTVFDGLGVADFTSVQQKRRIVGDVYGHTALFDGAMVGFINKCSVVSGVETPLVTSMDMGFGNEAACAPEGYHARNVFASQLTGPLLVKNPAMLQAVVTAIYQHRGQPAPAIPLDDYLTQGWAITAAQLKARCAK